MRKRKKRTVSRLHIAFVAFFIVVIGVAGLRSVQKHPRLPSHTAVVLVGEPFTLLHINYNSGQLTTIHIPDDTVIQAAHDYGEYSVKALWKLDQMEQRNGELFRESLEQAFGMPIPYIAYHTHDDKSKTKDATELMRLASLLSFRSKKIKTNMSLSQYIDIVIRYKSISSDNRRLIDLYTSSVVSDHVRGDGETVLLFDEKRFDALYSQWFEDEKIREEALRISIYNTTDIQGLGHKMERVLVRAGALIYTVDNDFTPRHTCELSGRPEVLSSNTVKFLLSYFQCEIVMTEDYDSTSDVSVWIGVEYAKNHLPYE